VYTYLYRHTHDSGPALVAMLVVGLVSVESARLDRSLAYPGPGYGWVLVVCERELISFC